MSNIEKKDKRVKKDDIVIDNMSADELRELKGRLVKEINECNFDISKCTSNIDEYAKMAFSSIAFIIAGGGLSGFFIKFLFPNFNLFFLFYMGAALSFDLVCIPLFDCRYYFKEKIRLMEVINDKKLIISEVDGKIKSLSIESKKENDNILDKENNNNNMKERIASISEIEYGKEKVLKK